MDVRPELAALAAKYHCDPEALKDPVLDVVLDLRQDLLNHLGGVDAAAIFDQWGRVGAELCSQTGSLKSAVTELGAERARVEDLAKKTAQALLSSRQITFRARASAFFVGLSLAGLTSGAGLLWMNTRSADAQLAKAHVRLSLESTRDGERITLQGARVLRSGQAADRLVVEFAR